MYYNYKLKNNDFAITDLSQQEMDTVSAGISTAEQLSGTAAALAGASALTGGPSNPVGGALLAAAATTEVIAIVVSIFG